MSLYRDEDFYNDDEECPNCHDYGRESGCPKCGAYRVITEKTVNGVKFMFVSNTKKLSELHEFYKNLKEKKQRKILFEPATDVLRRSMPDYVAIWIKEEDRSKESK